GQHLLGQGAAKLRFPALENGLEPFDAAEGLALRKQARWVDGKLPIAVAPTTHRIEVLEGEANGIHAGVAGRAVRIRAVLLHPLPKRSGGDSRLFLAQLLHPRRRRRRRGAEDW